MSKIIQRGDCFKLLAACFYEPEKQIFVEEEIGDKLAFLLKEISHEGAHEAEKLHHALQHTDQERLSIDHAALFVGPFELLAAPYGSVYIEKKRLVMGESTVNAARYYEEADLAVDLKEPPDHIVIELEFMYYLCNKEAHFISNGLAEEARKMHDIQLRFFHNAIRPWVYQFCENIEKGSDNPFYYHLAQCLRYFLVACEDFYVQTTDVTL